jgi:hypothetical protein
MKINDKKIKYPVYPKAQGMNDLRRKIDDKKRNRIQQLWDKGSTKSEISRICEVTWKSVARIVDDEFRRKENARIKGYFSKRCEREPEYRKRRRDQMNAAQRKAYARRRDIVDYYNDIFKYKRSVKHVKTN